jgi:CheY-like chemotaxis protein
VDKTQLLQAIQMVMGTSTSPDGSKPLITRHHIKENSLRGRVLLAEDNPVNQKLARILLEKLGHEVILARNGLEAVKLYQEKNPHLILMDVQMPEMDGISATQEIRLLEEAAGKSSRIPIIALTAHAMKGDRERILEAGMDEYLTKPIKRDELTAVIGNILKEQVH